jgi:hypothetical protein
LRDWCWEYVIEVIIEMIVLPCIHDILWVHWISIKDNLYRLAIMWIVYETLLLVWLF